MNLNIHFKNQRKYKFYILTDFFHLKKYKIQSLEYERKNLCTDLILKQYENMFYKYLWWNQH